MTYLKFSLLNLFICMYICSSCTGQTDTKKISTKVDSTSLQVQQRDITLPGGFSSQTTITFDSNFVNIFLNGYPQFKKYDTAIRQFYRSRSFSYAWFDDNGLIEQAGNLYNKIENIEEEGIAVKYLYQEDLQQLMEEFITEDSKQKADPIVELMLTAQYFFYAKNVWTGLGAKTMKEVNWDLPQKKLSLTDMLDSILNVPSSQFMLSEPVYPQYALLKKYLKKYRAIEELGGWPVIPSEKINYKKGDSSDAIASIRKRLFLSGDLIKDDHSLFFDNTLEAAVKNFQQRYGFKSDGIISKLLIAEMNYPVEKRIEQIIVNMERCRWLPVALKKDYVVVNIPEYRFHAYENDSMVWSMDVVVGSSLNKTAIFTGNMNNVVFSPYWNIPPGIMKNETLPAIKRDKNYLSRNHMEWNGKSVRQIPGPWNALGKVKFLFPNSHSIYLHDTPGKSAFGKDRRAFSHGCIRVSDPAKLANYVLRKQPEWTANKISAAMNASKEQYVKITNPIPVYIAYFTSWVDANGQLNFRNDVYNRDSRLAKMIVENSGL